MFDRGKNDKVDGAAVEITLGDGRELKGKFILPPGRALTEVLNGSSTFIEFEPFGGDRMLIAKSALQAVKQMDVPSPPNLSAGGKDNENFDPYAILRINRDTPAEDVRRAYLDLAKAYHPDRYATVDLPPEVQMYLSAMARRINAAYDTVQAVLKKREALATRQDPVFTKAGQA